MSRLLSSWDIRFDGLLSLRKLPVLPNKTHRTVWVPFGKHQSREKAEASLPFAFESSDARRVCSALPFVASLKIGGLACHDEFENDLHPHMLEPILYLFANPHTNPNDAQLIFTCHAVEVLTRWLNKAQVTLVEKDEHRESSACRLDAVAGIRNDDNFYAKYMAVSTAPRPGFNWEYGDEKMASTQNAFDRWGGLR